MNLQKEDTLILLKPDCIKRGLVSTVSNMLLQIGEIIYLDLTIPSRDQILEHYYENLSDKSDEIKERVFEYMGSGYVVVIVLQGNDIIKKSRELIGASDPLKASINTIRGKFGNDSYSKAISEKRSCYNLIHGSDSKESAGLEKKIWIK